MHYHISYTGQYRGTWSDALDCYKQIMRDPDNINFVTVLREPRAHLLSYYYYYMEPVTKVRDERMQAFQSQCAKIRRLLFTLLLAK